MIKKEIVVVAQDEVGRRKRIEKSMKRKRRTCMEMVAEED